jgi:formate hydrogenlyase subunit 3/multisubunit Na+/H+ antiporter MnhD subunit
MDLVGYTILIPFVAGALVRVIPDSFKGLKEGIALAVSAVTFYFAIVLFRQGWLESEWFGRALFKVDTLSSFVLLWVGFFALIMVLYSLGFMRGKPNLKQYYGYMLWTLGGAVGVVLANDLVVLLAFWGWLGLTLYLLVGVGGPRASAAAKKTMTIVGGTDALLLFAVAIVWILTGSTSLGQEAIPTITGLTVLAFVLFAAAAFAKAGVMPFHSWVPDASEYAPVPVAAFLPASLDKLLGIYLLARVSLYLFSLSRGMALLLLIVGSFTIIAAVMMALVQRDLKRLLGIGTLNPIGVAGALFHMLNYTIYKSSLFMSAGAVELREGTTDMDKLGGLSRYMPVTFITTMVAALAVSGVPPLNGFVSKWMVYQGIIELGRSGGHVWVIWLIAAMFGSALTLAIFMKVLHSVFLGVRDRNEKRASEVGPTMSIPMVILAALCLVFGIFAYAIPLSGFILPAVRGVSWMRMPGMTQWLGWWSPGLATLLILVGIAFGLIIYLSSRFRTARTDTAYVGGEVLTEDTRLTGADFYATVSDMGFFHTMYKWAERKAFDTYDIGQRISFYFIRGFKAIHTGILPEYLTWVLAGMLVLVVLLLR